MSSTGLATVCTRQAESEGIAAVHTTDDRALDFDSDRARGERCMTVGMPVVDTFAVFRGNPVFLQGNVPASTGSSWDPVSRACSPDR